MSTSETSAPQPKGHPIGFRFFFWGEFAERFSFYGMRAILALYMANELGFSKADAGLYQSLFLAAVYFTPLIGGYVADNFLGKYWTIVGFSLPYLVGQLLVGFPNNYVFVASLALLAMGSGVIKPNISSLMGMTYDQQRPGQETLRSAAFSWFYFAVNVGAFLSQILVPYMRDNYGYRVAFLTPFFFMAIALAIFAMGKKHYANETKKLEVEVKEPLAERIKIFLLVTLLFSPCWFFWAIFDQSSITWVYFTDTYSNTTLKIPFLGSVLFSSDGLQWFNSLFVILFVPVSIFVWKWLDKKGIKIKPATKLFTGLVLTAVCMFIMAAAGSQAGKKTETLKISTPIADILVPINAIELDGKKLEIDKHNTLVFVDDTEYQGGRLEDGTVKLNFGKGKIKRKKIEFTDGTLEIPEGNIVFKNGYVDVESSTALFQNGNVRFKQKLNLPGTVHISWKESVLQPGNKSAFQIKDNVIVESTVKQPENTLTISNFEYVPQVEKVTVWYQILAYFILTIAEILVSITGLELAFVIAPQSMKSLISGCWLATVGVGNLAINAPITSYYPEMQPGKYFAMLGVIMFVAAIAFLFIARFVTKAMHKEPEPAQ